MGLDHLNRIQTPLGIVDGTVRRAVAAVAVNAGETVAVAVSAVNIIRKTGRISAESDRIVVDHMAVDRIGIDEPVSKNDSPLGIERTGYVALLGVLVDRQELVGALQGLRNGLGGPFRAVRPIDDDAGNEDLIRKVILAEAAFPFYYPGEKLELLCGQTYGSCLDLSIHVITLLVGGLHPDLVVGIEFLLGRLVKNFNCIGDCSAAHGEHHDKHDKNRD